MHGKTLRVNIEMYVPKYVHTYIICMHRPNINPIFPLNARKNIFSVLFFVQGTVLPGWQSTVSGAGVARGVWWRRTIWFNSLLINK